MFYNIGYFDDDDDDDFVVIILLWEIHLFNAISAILKSALFASAAAKIEQNWSPPRDTKGKYIFIREGIRWKKVVYFRTFGTKWAKGGLYVNIS